MRRRFLFQGWVLALSGALMLPGFTSTAQAAVPAGDLAPDVFIKTMADDVLGTIKTDKLLQKGDMPKLMALVDTKVMPNVDFQRMTASAVGPAWRQATPAQKARLQEEFKTLLVRTYAGAVSQVIDMVLTIKPLRSAPEDTEVLVRSEVKGTGDPVQLDYRLAKTPGQGYGWRIYNLNVMGIWLVDNYRSQFAQTINAKGIDGLIDALAERNKANAKKD
jgi:phospholipid transport system substrate-binding protein